MGRVGVGLARVLLATTALVLPASAAFGAETTQYTYDALGRVVSALDGSGKKVVYTYDSVGNRARVSNGAEFQEIVPTAWSASSTAGTTGLTAANGLRDGDFASLASIHATQSGAGAWIMADLGVAKAVNHIDVAPAVSSEVGASPDDLNDTALEYSVDGISWRSGATVNGVSAGVTRTFALGGVTLRYLRLRRTVSGRVALGDLRLFSAAAANSPLIAEPDSIASAGAAVTFDPRANDRDLDGHPFSITAVEDPPHGLAVINGGASITYTPDAGYFGADGFTYTVADGHNGTASGHVGVLVRSSTNHPPVAVNDQFTVSDRSTALADGLNNLRPLGNDHDLDGDILTITGISAPAHGLATIVGANVVEYRPTVSYNGTDSLTYTISDGRGGAATATMTLTIGNTAPNALADRVNTSRNRSVTFDPRLNDGDPNGDSITVTAVSSALAGAATLNGDQTITYQPNFDIAGGDTFTYTLSDGRGGTATGHVTAVISPNATPEARGDNILASSSAVMLNPMANDIDADNDPLTVVSIGTPAHGTAQILSGGPMVVYTPASGYIGTDSFTYTISDDEGATATATVAVNATNIDYLVVAGGGGGAGGGGTGTWGGHGGAGGVLAGSTVLQSGTALTATVGAGGAGGAYGSGGYDGTGSALNSLTVTVGGGGGGSPGSGAGRAGGSGGGGGGGYGFAAGGAGTPGQGNNGMPGSSMGPGAGGSAGRGQGVTSSISGAPVVYGHSGSRGGGGSGRSGTSAGTNGTAGVVIVAYLGTPKATGGAITQVAGRTIHTFTSNGTFAVTGLNLAPAAVDDARSTPLNTPLTLDPRVNDSDPTGEALRIHSIGAPSHGTATVVQAGGAITYTPAPGYTGADSFTYMVGDIQGATASATITITVGSPTPRTFGIAPAVSGKSAWNLDVDGPLNLGAAGTWTITPWSTFTGSTKAWGAGGGRASVSGGGGGYAAGGVKLHAGVGYTLTVGGGGGGALQIGGTGAGGAPGGGASGGPPVETAEDGTYSGAGGGGYSGFVTGGGAPILLAGGGGGSSNGSGAPGAGGGVNGQSATNNNGAGAQGGSQTAGGAAQTGGGAGGALFGGYAAELGGGGGGGYFGGGGSSYSSFSASGGGGGGSGYLHPTDVSGGILTAGSGATPGASTDSQRAGAGAGGASAAGTAGRVILY